MARPKLRRVFPSLIASSLVVGGALAGGNGRVRVGEPFPLLVLPSAEDGRPASLEENRGRKVVLHVFASW